MRAEFREETFYALFMALLSRITKHLLARVPGWPKLVFDYSGDVLDWSWFLPYVMQFSILIVLIGGGGSNGIDESARKSPTKGFSKDTCRLRSNLSTVNSRKLPKFDIRIKEY